MLLAKANLLSLLRRSVLVCFNFAFSCVPLPQVQEEAEAEAKTKKTRAGGAWRALVHARFAGSGQAFSAAQVRAVSQEYRNMSAEEKLVFAQIGRRAILSARAGGDSFPAHSRAAERKRGTPASQCVHPEPAPTFGDPVEAAVYRQCQRSREHGRALRAEHEQAVATLQAYHRQHSQRMLRANRLLDSPLCCWVATPHSSEALECVVEMANLPMDELRAGKSTAELEQQWRQLHQGIMERELQQRVPMAAQRFSGLKPTRGSCCITGVCFCEPDCHRFLLRIRERLKASLADSDLLDRALRGHVIANWLQAPRAGSTGAEEEEQAAEATNIWTSIPLFYQSPWRPTLLRLVASAADAEEGCLHFLAEETDGMPSFHTFTDFVAHTLDKEKQITVSWHVLCVHDHLDHLHRGVYVAKEPVATVKLWSSNNEEKKRKPLASRPLHERLSRMSTKVTKQPPRPRAGQLPPGHGHAASSSDDTLVAPIAIAEAVASEVPENASEELLDLETAFEAEDWPEWAELGEEHCEAEELANPEVPDLLLELTANNLDGQSGDSSAEDVGPEGLEGPDIDPGLEACPEEVPTEGPEGPELDPGLEARPQNALAQLQLVAFTVGVFRITPKPPGPGNRFGGYQGACCFHAKSDSTKCKKFSPLAGNTEKHRKQALLRLHVWLLNYSRYTLQREHVGENFMEDVTAVDTRSLRRRFAAVTRPLGKVLTDREIDEAAGVDPDDAPRRVSVKRRRVQ